MPGKSRFLADTLAAVEGSLQESGAKVSDAQSREPDFPYAWQKGLGYRLRFQLSRFKPSIDDFDWLPLNARWRILYFFTRPIRVLASRVSGQIV